MKDIILTGDRPTGKLHLGHYVGSLKNRINLQLTCLQYIIIADTQALTDNYDNPQKVRDNVLEVMLDYLAVGIDPTKSTIFIQSMIPALYELSMHFMNLVTVSRLARNPTVKSEIAQKGLANSLPVGFFVYPISQAADILAFKATIVPVGNDQLPMIEQANEIAKSFNRIYKKDIFVQSKAIISKIPRLSGTNGQEKMSKSLNNAIYLSEEIDSLAKKVKSMYTDSNHLKIEDKGQVEGNTVFEYLDAFGSDQKETEKLKEHYKNGGLADSIIKKYLLEQLEDFIKPIRERRKILAQDPHQILNILLESTKKANETANQTLMEAKEVMKLNF